MINFFQNEKRIVLENSFISFIFDKEDCSYAIVNGNSSLTSIRPVINIFDNDNIVTILPTQTDVDANLYSFIDKIGSGKEIRISLKFNYEGSEIFTYLDASIYDNYDFIVVILSVTSSSKLDINIHSLAPLFIDKGAIVFDNEKIQGNRLTWLENGYQSWSRTLLRKNNDYYEELDPGFMKISLENQERYLTGKWASEWVTAITDVGSEKSLILGFITFDTCLSRIVMNPPMDSSVDFDHLIAYSQYDNIEMKNREFPLSSEELFIKISDKGRGYQDGLIEYAKIVGTRYHPSSTRKNPLYGWCSWYYYYLDITEEEMKKNITYFRTHSDLPLQLVQLDDGYFTTIGDFLTENEKFPSGIPALVDSIHQIGKLAGIWIAPFVAPESSNLFKEHSDWFLRDSDGELIETIYNWDESQYALDLTKDEVLNHVKNVIRTLTSEWKIDFIKIDFIYSAIPYDACYTQKQLTRAEILRLGVKTIREAMKPNQLLLGCGAPLGPCIGLVDIMRVSCDTREEWDSPLDPIYSIPSLKPALINTIMRSFMNNYFWINDPDCLIVREHNSELSENEIELQVTVFGLCGGQLFLSEDMSLLEEKGRRLYLSLVPPYKETAIPIDALEEYPPTIYKLDSDYILGKRSLVAIFNWKEEKVNRNIKIKRLIPTLSNLTQDILVWDYWNEKIVGVFSLTEELEVELGQHSCKYFCFIPFTDNSNPVFISTNLHITQGCFSITSMTVNDSSLSIVINLPGKREGSFFVLIPNNKTLKTDYTIIQTIETLKMNLAKILISFIDDFRMEVELK